MEKEIYQRIELDIIPFTTEDVIATSSTPKSDPYEDIIPN